MRGEGSRLSVRPVLAEARTENDRQRHRTETTHGMNDGRTGKIHITMAQMHRRSELRHPAAAPHPAAENGIEEGANEELAHNESPKCNSLADRPDDDVACRLHEDDLEQREHVAARVIGRPAQEEALPAKEAPETATDQKVIERRRPAEIRGRRVHRDGPELKGIADGVVRQKCEHVRRKVQHHEMCGVLSANQAAREQSNPGLHEQDEVAGIECPRRIRCDSDVADRVGQLQGQRLSRCLSLVFVERFFLRRVVRIGFVGRFGNHEGSARWQSRMGLAVVRQPFARRSLDRPTDVSETLQLRAQATPVANT